MRNRRLLGAAALSTLVVAGLAGCMKVDMQMELQSDNTIDGTMIFGISSAAAEMMGEDAASLAEQMQSSVLPSGEEGDYQQEPYDDGEYVGTKVTFTDAPIDSFASEGTESDSLQIVRDGDEFVVTGAMDLADTSGTDLSAMPGLADSFDVKISITFPGKVSDHTGELNGNTVTWAPKYGERTEISARGSAVPGGGSDLPIALIAGIAAAALLLIGLVLFFVLRGRRKAEPAVAAGYPTEGYVGYAPAPEGFAPAAPVTPEGYAPPAPPVPPAPAAPPAPPAPPADDQQSPPPPPVA